MRLRRVRSLITLPFLFVKASKLLPLKVIAEIEPVAAVGLILTSLISIFRSILTTFAGESLILCFLNQPMIFFTIDGLN